MAETVLITGGAGFIGSHLADHLLKQGYDVRALDTLVEQVHGGVERPDYLSPEVDLHIGDIRDRAAVDRALDGVERVVHFAARVGVGQSMYEIAEYTSVNSAGTAVLLEAMLDRPVAKLVVASSMSVYGEGRYLARGREVRAVAREAAQLESGDWEPRGPRGEQLEPVATPERKLVSLSSIYALNKYEQERMCLLYGAAYDVPTVALRLFNVYGPYQALSNPYTGVLAIFAGRLLNEKPPLIFEDGMQRRDFVHVADVARACALALIGNGADGMVVNVGSGNSYTVCELAERLARVMGKEQIQPRIAGKYRVGDIRHCFADISLAGETLGFKPEVELDDGLGQLAGWLEGQVATDRVDHAADELAARGLTR